MFHDAKWYKIDIIDVEESAASEEGCIQFCSEGRNSYENQHTYRGSL